MSALTDHHFCFLLPGEPYLLNVTVDSLFIFPFLCFCFIYNKNFKWKKHLSGFWDSVYGGGGLFTRGQIFIYLFIHHPFILKFCKISSYFSSKRDFEHKNTDIHVEASDTGQVFNH